MIEENEVAHRPEVSHDNPKIPIVELQEFSETEQARAYQEQKTRERWRVFSGHIVEKDFSSNELRQHLRWFLDRWSRSKDEGSEEPGGWKEMAGYVSSDAKLAAKIDELIANAPAILPGWENPQLEKGADTDVQQARAAFLDSLLARSKDLFHGEEASYTTEEQSVATLWSEFLGTFREARVQALSDRIETLQSEISRIKDQKAAYLQTERGDVVSPEGLERVRTAKVWILDEYLEHGSGWMVNASYNASSRDIVVSGQKIRSSQGRKKWQETFDHELTHAASGHGAEPQNSEEAAGNPWLRRTRRIGTSGEDRRNTWLNEALTEDEHGQNMDVSDDRRIYSVERLVLSHLEKKFGLPRTDLLKWYYHEGDDSAVKAELDARYPGFFRSLDALREATKGQKGFERIQSAKQLDKLLSIIDEG